MRASSAMPRNLLLTGAPGVGKTTVVREVVQRLRACRLRGFYTEEIRERGQRQGFRVVTCDGRTAVLAHVGLASPYRVGRYGVDVAGFTALVASLLAPDPAVDAYVVDEIGKMECLSPAFVSAVQALLEAEAPLIATVAARGGGFIAAVKQRPDVEQWQVTHANRALLPQRVVAWLEALKSRAP